MHDATGTRFLRPLVLAFALTLVAALLFAGTGEAFAGSGGATAVAQADDDDDGSGDDDDGVPDNDDDGVPDNDDDGVPDDDDDGVPDDDDDGVPDDDDDDGVPDDDDDDGVPDDDDDDGVPDDDDDDGVPDDDDDDGDGDGSTAARASSRIQGADRFETSVRISETAFPNGAGIAYIARADDFADALAGGALANGPILLVPADGSVPEVVLAEVRRLGASQVVALGGPGAVSDSVLAQVANA